MPTGVEKYSNVLLSPCATRGTVHGPDAPYLRGFEVPCGDEFGPDEQSH
jgi:hypothetical protein